MTKITRYGFIFIGPGYNKRGEVIKLDSNQFNSQIVAVSSVDDACEVANKLINEGIQLIELCGGFTKEDLDKINLLTSNKVPIGLVEFNEKESEKLNLILKK